MYFPQGLCFSLPSACSDASQNWNKLELETKIAAAWGGRAALLLRLIPPTTLHELTSVKETVCKLIWPYRSSLTTSEMQIHECTSTQQVWRECLSPHLCLGGLTFAETVLQRFVWDVPMWMEKKRKILIQKTPLIQEMVLFERKKFFLC